MGVASNYYLCKCAHLFVGPSPQHTQDGLTLQPMFSFPRPNTTKQGMWSPNNPLHHQRFKLEHEG